MHLLCEKMACLAPLMLREGQFWFLRPFFFYVLLQEFAVWYTAYLLACRQWADTFQTSRFFELARVLGGFMLPLGGD